MAGDRLDDLMLRVKAIQGRVAAAPALRWGTVTATSPLSVLLDGAPDAFVGVSNAGPRALIVGQRVRVDVQGTRVTVVSAARDDLRGTSAQRVALGASGVMQDGMRFFDTGENLEYVWAGGWKPLTNRVLWEGVSFMHGTQSAVLNERVSAQHSGIMLVFSEYSSGTARNYGWQHRPVAREHISLAAGSGIYFPMRGTTVSGMKYLYVHDDKIDGNANNDQNGNNAWVLRQVLGI